MSVRPAPLLKHNKGGIPPFLSPLSQRTPALQFLGWPQGGSQCTARPRARPGGSPEPGPSPPPTFPTYPPHQAGRQPKVWGKAELAERTQAVGRSGLCEERGGRKGRGKRSLGEETGVQRPNQEAGGQGVKVKLRDLGGLPAAPHTQPSIPGAPGPPSPETWALGQRPPETGGHRRLG